MEEFFSQVGGINEAIKDFVWDQLGVWLLLAAGVILTCCSGFFQITHIRHWWKNTIGSLFSKGAKSRKNKEKGAISQFQALCTALAATIGTGNIAGVASAICVGGAGAVFWMWVAAFFGMITNYSENILGIYFRRKNKKGEWSGGPMYYIKDGFGKYKGCKTIAKILAVLFASFAVLASFGIGNLGQTNKIVINLQNAFFEGTESAIAFGNVSWMALILGLVLTIVGALIILGGLQRIAAFAEKVVPFMAIIYVVGALVIMGVHITEVGAAFAIIFKCAFGVQAVAGGFAGVAVKEVITQGCKRGIFSNEAGLGSSVMVHSNSNVVEPVKQGLWGIFEVFADTIVVCTMTAIVVLTSGAIDLNTGAVAAGTKDATLVATAFGNVFGKPGVIFIALCVLLFAFTTVLGWSHYGSKAFEYLFGEKAAVGYRAVFVVLIAAGPMMSSSLAWEISDTFNGLMMIPNLIGVLSLTPIVLKVTRNYRDRIIHGKPIKPMLSAIPEVQEEMEAKLSSNTNVEE
ncbi:MAG: alanine:cation symporter family protein [Lachnospiraceae bacterium]|nr:alanine:cation symporter family protein [Candidatus Merdinaster equi]